MALNERDWLAQAACSPLLRFSFSSRLFLHTYPRARARACSSITWTRTHLGTLRSGLRSQNSATRCPCALNKCENSACVRARRVVVAPIPRGAPLTRLLRERRVSYFSPTPTPTATNVPLSRFCPPFFPSAGIRLPFSVARRWSAGVLLQVLSAQVLPGC